MFSHVFLGTQDFTRARAFYEPLMALLGIPVRFVDEAKGWMGWQSEPGPRPLLLLGRPFDGQPHAAGNGQMVALQAATREQVDAFHALALSLGARDEGAPGLRPHYHAHYYGTYVRDLDGNKLCVVCHQAA
ncbi:VOC family protein [Roseateles paludis]|jgi:lactoylglutathione lyase|uniref:VOC family protein n=1 Tax=Roseateles paludis TaxID=3145238 RepID=A0ABV0FY72_9BURK